MFKKTFLQEASLILLKIYLKRDPRHGIAVFGIKIGMEIFIKVLYTDSKGNRK